MQYVDPRRIIVATVSFVIFMTLLVAVGLWHMYADAIEDGAREVNDIAKILSEEVAHSTRGIEIILDEIIVEVRRRDGESDAGYAARLKGKALFDYFQQQMSRLPQADAMAVATADGMMVNTSRYWPTTPIDVNDRDYFRNLKEHAISSLTVAEPIISRTDGRRMIYFNKRIETPDGHFAGIVYIGMRPDYFMRSVSVLAQVSERSMALLRNDGAMLVRYPDAEIPTGFRMPKESPWYGAASVGGQYRSSGLFDQKARLVSVQPVPGYPMVVDISISEDEVLDDWKSHAFLIISISLVVELLFVLLMWSLHRHFVRLRQSELALSAKTNDIELVNKRFAAALSNTTQGIAMFGQTGNLLIKNAKFGAILGSLAIEFIVGSREFRIIGSDDELLRQPRFCRYDGDRLITLIARGGESDIVKLSDGRFIRITLETMAEGGWVTTLEDVTQAELANAEIVRMAHYDGLTSLANRTKFLSELSEWLGGNASHTIGVMLLDLDHFKEVNDTFGHGLGDALLQEVAGRFQACLREGDIAARLGGDEFAIMCQIEDGEIRDLTALAIELLNSISLSFDIQDNDISVGLSVGIAFGRPGEHSVEQVMRHADLALYEAKSDGRNCYRVFEEHMEERFNQRKLLTNDLELAIKRDELDVHYQPIVDCKSLKIKSMEALVRWKHSKRGMISPADFIPLAEESGLIYALGEWVLERACLDATKWPSYVRVSVNVSTLQLTKANFSQIVAKILRDTELPASRLKLEITESVLLAETAHGLANLNALHALGVAISLDDFGTGYSSLSYLKRFYFDEIKIDKSFVDGLGTHRGSTAIIAATITLARELGIETTAEGVETHDQQVLLQASGVQQLQGYLFGRPAPASNWPYELFENQLPEIKPSSAKRA